MYADRANMVLTTVLLILSLLLVPVFLVACWNVHSRKRAELRQLREEFRLQKAARAAGLEPSLFTATIPPPGSAHGLRAAQPVFSPRGLPLYAPPPAVFDRATTDQVIPDLNLMRAYYNNQALFYPDIYRQMAAIGPPVMRTEPICIERPPTAPNTLPSSCTDHHGSTSSTTATARWRLFPNLFGGAQTGEKEREPTAVPMVDEPSSPPPPQKNDSFREAMMMAGLTSADRIQLVAPPP